MKITTLCFGNINRSPAAKYVLEKLAKDIGLEIEVDSAGTSNYNAGKKANKRMRDMMEERGYDLSDHRAKQITLELLDSSDIVVYMDDKNLKKMRTMFTPEQLGTKLVKLSMFSEFDDIEDPHFATSDVAHAMFTTVIDQIIQASNDLLQQVKMGTKIEGPSNNSDSGLFDW